MPNNLSKKNQPIVFQDKSIRRNWDENQQEWYFSVVDIIAVLTDSPRPRKYWNALKTKLQKEGSQLSQELGQLKMLSNDGKMRLTDVATTKTIFRLVQSIPSPKAEPFKLWLAKVGDDRINEIYDPELAINRAIQSYQKKGYDKKWINQRLKSIEIRKELTDEWQNRGVKEGLEYAILTNGDLCINMNNHQNTLFHQLGNFLKTPLALLGADLKNSQFNKIWHFANHPYLRKCLQ